MEGGKTGGGRFASAAWEVWERTEGIFEANVEPVAWGCLWEDEGWREMEELVVESQNTEKELIYKLFNFGEW